jgi:hypothetical protein
MGYELGVMGWGEGMGMGALTLTPTPTHQLITHNS